MKSWSLIHSIFYIVPIFFLLCFLFFSLFLFPSFSSPLFLLLYIVYFHRLAYDILGTGEILVTKLIRTYIRRLKYLVTVSGTFSQRVTFPRVQNRKYNRYSSKASRLRVKNNFSISKRVRNLKSIFSLLDVFLTYIRK